jgi:flavin reductase (DIM6/NTAB) family NADH-FMN oxidoreductase RutF
MEIIAMSKIFYTHDEIVGRPRLEGKDPSHVHFHFRPARPANFCVTLDPDTQEVNVMAGTIGPLTWNPYTMCMHIDRHNSVDTYRNLQRTDECVVALPGKDIIPQTWMCELHVPRGISELEVAKLTPFASKFVKPPSIMECKVNFECKVEFFKDYYSHGIVFVRVVGASIDEEILNWSREEIVSLYPTYEVDDIQNPDIGRGAIERLGVMGEIFECPRFPVGPKSGWGGTFQSWIQELRDDRFISSDEYEAIMKIAKKHQQLFYDSYSKDRPKVREQLTRICQMLAWQEWQELHKYLSEI